MVQLIQQQNKESSSSINRHIDSDQFLYNIIRIMIFIDELPSLFQYHKSSKQLNLQTITIWVSKQKFIIVPNLNKSRIPTTLQIDRKTKTIKQHTKMKQEAYKHLQPHHFSCIVGILDLNGKKIIVLAEQVKIIGSIGQRDVFKIAKPIYLFYDPKDKKIISEKQADVLLNITAIFEQGMYFSFSYDLSLRMNSKYQDHKQKQSFNWAYNLQKEFEPFDPMWRVSVIQGFIGRLELHINGLKLTVVLISRRAVKRGGTHTFARGIDKQGNAGNYVQTQQILIIKDHYFSFVQCRGTVPIFWSQVKSTYGFSSVKFEGNLEQNFMGFQKHLSLIQQRAQYRDVFLLNLLSSTKQEKKLVQNYEYLVRKLKKELNFQVKYAYFDVHSTCNNKEYFKLNDFLETHMRSAINYCNFTALRIDRLQKKIQVLSNQSGIIRTNCFNCIDRTNIAQCRIAALKLMEILSYLEIQINQFKNGLKFISNSSPFSNLYRNLWADNGDALSKQYTGTGSTESFAVRKGKLSYLTTLDHGMKSIFRAIRNFTNQDLKKQQAISCIVGQRLSESKQSQSYLPGASIQMVAHKVLFENQPQESYQNFVDKKSARSVQ